MFIHLAQSRIVGPSFLIRLANVFHLWLVIGFFLPIYPVLIAHLITTCYMICYPHGCLDSYYFNPIHPWQWTRPQNPSLGISWRGILKAGAVRELSGPQTLPLPWDLRITESKGKCRGFCSFKNLSRKTESFAATSTNELSEDRVCKEKSQDW